MADMNSRLLGDPIYESYARRAVESLWQSRDNVTGLFGNVMNIHSKKWVSTVSGLGAGIDSFFEYLLKSHILFEHEPDRLMFEEAYATIKQGRIRLSSLFEVESGTDFINFDRICN